VVVSLLAGVGGLLFPDLRPVFVALAGIGGLSAVFTYFLTPERVLTADTAEQVYLAYATTISELAAELGLSETYVYVPTTSGPAVATNVKLYVPQAAEYDLPESGELDGVVIASERGARRGLAVVPTGATLLREFEAAIDGQDVPGGAAAAAERLATAIVDLFEFADDAAVVADDRGGSITIGVVGAAYGPLSRFDHPVVSFLGAGLARRLNHPVRVEVRDSDDPRYDALVVCTWSGGAAQ
jgi:hypothetical protein